MFESREEYESIIETPTIETENNVKNRIATLGGHISYLDLINSSDISISKSDIHDDFFALLLSRDKTIRIGAYILKISDDRMNVLALRKTNISSYLDLKNENVSNPQILSFSVDLEILDELDRIEAGNPPNYKGKLFCFESGAKGKDNLVEESFVDKYGIQVFTETYAHYNKYGVYFSLVGYHYQKTNPTSGVVLHGYIQVENRWFKAKCANPQGPYSHPWRGDFSATQKTQRYKTYSSSKGLNGYHLKVRGRIEEWNRPQGNNPYTIHFSNWVSICDNASPFC